MGWLSDKLFGKRKKVNQAHIANVMKPAHDMMNQQIDWSKQLMDPKSAINMRLRNMMAQRSAETGAQQAQQMQKIAAMTGMSGGQAAMQSRMAMQNAMGGMNDQFIGMQQGQFNQGLSLYNLMHEQMKQKGQADVNMHLGDVNASNARRAQNQGIGMSVLGGFLSDRRLKQNIRLVGISHKGYNVYEFDYKDNKYGPDRYRGVMAQEVPFASMKDSNGYYFVDYSHPDLDVDFERIK